MDFLPTLPTYGSDIVAQTVWSWFEARLRGTDGIAYYKYPTVGGAFGAKPDLTIVARGFQPIVLRCVPYQLQDLVSVQADTWEIRKNGGTEQIDSPNMELDDFRVGLQQKFDRERRLRKKITVVVGLVMPMISAAEFTKRFGEIEAALWSEQDVDSFLTPSEELDDQEWKLARSVMQAAVPLNKSVGVIPRTPQNFGEAIKILEADIALLDIEQHKAATQIPPGPQRIRGLAGTGKTVLLAMKAANIHRQLPDKRILFTFNTQSLYNQTRTLISKFYRHFSDEDPDWNVLHVRHAWGGRARPGVYYDLCSRQGVQPLDLLSARSRNREEPFRACCMEALSGPIEPQYDYILVDEAQDFPREFFRILYSLATPPEKALYWAYDEMQSLSSLEIPNTTELFGSDANGQPLVSLEGEYPGPMDKDFVLHKSYRCPRDILMTAHAIGLGLYRRGGPVQMLGDINSWRSIGYELDEGTLRQGEQVTFHRPEENSPNRISEIYGRLSLLTATRFEDRDQELEWIANAIQSDIVVERMAPEQIIVISLDSRRAKKYMSTLQAFLWDRKIASTIPGLVDDKADFAEQGKVTLATVYRAKGNEAPIVYILSFDSLFDYVEEIGNRNRAFTSISRSKAVVRITGVGTQMIAAVNEIERIKADLPRFKFIFPDVEKIRKLDAIETTRRRREVRKAKDAALKLAEVDTEALRKLDPEVRKELLKKLAEVQDEAQ